MFDTVGNNKKTIITFNIILSLFVIGCSFFNNTNIDILLLLVTIFMFISLFSYKPDLFLKYFFSIFYAIYMLLGVFICNNSNIFLFELGQFSHYNGSFLFSIFYNLLFIFSIFIFDKYFSNKILSNIKNKINSKNYAIIYFIYFIVGLFLFAFVFKNPSFNLNIDRFKYSNQYLPNWIVLIQNNLIYFIPLLLLPILSKNDKISKKNMIKILFVLFPFLLFGIWSGNKFGLFLNIFILLLTPISYYISIRNEIFKKNINVKKIIVLSFLFLLVLLTPYYLLRGLDLEDSILNRTAQQGQLWWRTYELEENSPNRLEELSDEYEAVKNYIMNKSVNDNYGIYKIMKLTTPSSLYNSKLSRGSRYSAQGIEIAFYYFKYLGLMVHPILRAFVEVLLVNLLIKFLFSYRFFATYVVSRLILIAHFIFTQGDIYRLFSKTVILLILLLVFENLLYEKGKKYEKRIK